MIQNVHLHAMFRMMSTPINPGLHRYRKAWTDFAPCLHLLRSRSKHVKARQGPDRNSRTHIITQDWLRALPHVSLLTILKGVFRGRASFAGNLRRAAQGNWQEGEGCSSQCAQKCSMRWHARRLPGSAACLGGQLEPSLRQGLLQSVLILRLGNAVHRHAQYE
jgi:hypothetical protein